MLDEEKDLFIKKSLQQDKTISSKANSVFKNFENQYLNSNKNNEKTANKNQEINKSSKDKNTYNLFSKIKTFTAVAASFVVAVSVGTGLAIYSNIGNNNDNNSEYKSINIDKVSTAADYTVVEVKNEEVKVEEKEENKELKTSENNLIKASLLSDGSVTVQLKQDFSRLYKLKLDSSKMYKVSKISGKVQDIFVCSMVSKEFPYLLLLVDGGTVEVVQIFSEENTPGTASELFFYDQGKIEGLKNIKSFEEKTEPIADSEKLYYYVNAIDKDGTKKIIDNLEYVNMNDISNNKVTFSSQDGNKKYSITADEDDYVQGFGWAGASNNVFYINDNCLYHKNLIDGKEEKLLTGAESIKIDEDGVIVVKEKFTNCVHKRNQYVKLEQYNVTDSKVIDKKENENYIVCLKEDGSITVELKNGAIKKVGAKEYFKEGYIYNFYAGEYSVQVNNQYSNYDVRKQGVNRYANATAVYLGKIGTQDKNCLAYATKNNELVVLDIDLFVKNSTGCSFEGEPGTKSYILSQGKQNARVKEMNEITLTLHLKNGETKECKAIETIDSNGNKSFSSIYTVLINEGISNYTIDAE